MSTSRFRQIGVVNSNCGVGGVGDGFYEGVGGGDVGNPQAMIEVAVAAVVVKARNSSNRPIEFTVI